MTEIRTLPSEEQILQASALDENNRSAGKTRKEKLLDALNRAGILTFANEAMRIGLHDVSANAFMQGAAIEIKEEALAARQREELKQKKLDDKARLEAEKIARDAADNLRSKQENDAKEWQKQLTVSQKSLLFALNKTRHTPIEYNDDNKKIIEVFSELYTAKTSRLSDKVILIPKDDSAERNTAIELQKTKTGTKATYIGTSPFNEETASRFLKAALLGKTGPVTIRIPQGTDVQKALIYKLINDLNKSRGPESQIKPEGFDYRQYAQMHKDSLPGKESALEIKDNSIPKRKSGNPMRQLTLSSDDQTAEAAPVAQREQNKAATTQTASFEQAPDMSAAFAEVKNTSSTPNSNGARVAHSTPTQSMPQNNLA